MKKDEMFELIQENIDEICELLIELPENDAEDFYLLESLQNFENWLHRYKRLQLDDELVARKSIV